MTTTWTKEADQRLRRYLHRDGYVIPKGLGTREAASSIAAINLALTGELSNDIPECMSEVIGAWILYIQDGIPDDLRNSSQWKGLLPLAAGTGREHEQERAEIILDWLWGTVLPYVQPLADKGGFGGEWQAMHTYRTTARVARVAMAAAEAVRTAEEEAWAALAEAWAVFDPPALLRRLVP